jgi:hypothetical protein
MARVDVTVTSDMRPMEAWAMASDLERFDEWMTIFGGWRSPLPTQIEEGTQVSSLIKVKAFRNIIHWEVTRFEVPTAIAMSGRGRGGVRITLTMSIVDRDPGTEFHLVADFSGGLLNTKIGDLTARLLESDVRNSVQNLAALR